MDFLSFMTDSCRIIVVSAVCADPVKSWRAGSSKSTWLEDDLLRHLPLARVRFYDHSVAPEDDLGDLADRLSKLLEKPYLDGSRSENALDYPIIFLCHSTGGLVLKMALNLIREHAQYMSPKFLKSIIGVAFFG